MQTELTEEHTFCRTSLRHTKEKTKLNVKLLRRVFCVVMCVVVLACSSVNAFGTELYNSNYPLRWSSNGLFSLYFQWYGLSFETDNGIGETIENNLVAGTNFWASQSIVNASLVSPNTPNSIIHSMPTQDWWEAYWDYNYAISAEAAGITFVYDMNYNIITAENVMYSNGYIKDAIIYYNPTDAMLLYQGSFACLVAHEIGHALGFGHHTTVDSIMRQGPKNYTSLQQQDVEDLVAKYAE